MAKISVILPVFNGEEYIRQAISSTLNQTFKDFELIIIDDGSTDSTPNIIRQFKDNRIKIMTQSNQGPGAARNNALKVAEGDYIMYLDSDDFFKPDALETAYHEITRFNADLTFFKMINFDGEKYYPNDWFELNQFDESCENRIFKPEETPGSILICQSEFARKSIPANF